MKKIVLNYHNKYWSLYDISVPPYFSGKKLVKKTGFFSVVFYGRYLRKTVSLFWHQDLKPQGACVPGFVDGN